MHNAERTHHLILRLFFKAMCAAELDQRKLKPVLLLLMLVVAVVAFDSAPVPVKGDTPAPMSWITDNVSVLHIKSNKIVRTKRGEIPSNAIYTRQGCMRAGEYYWKFSFNDLEHNGALIGVTTMEKFRAGSSIQGLFYGGDLSNGFEPLVEDFGPQLSNDVTVGMLVSYKGHECSVYFDYNGKSLGVAFTVPASELQDAYPAVQFLKPGSVVCVKESNIPTDRRRTQVEYSTFLGSWRLLQLTHKDCLVDLPILPKIRVESDYLGQYIVTAKVRNSMYFTLIPDKDKWKGSMSQTPLRGQSKGAYLLPSVPVSLKFQELENHIRQVFASTFVMFKDAAQNLVFEATEAKRIAVFERSHDAVKPYNGNPFTAKTSLYLS